MARLEYLLKACPVWNNGNNETEGLEYSVGLARGFSHSVISPTIIANVKFQTSECFHLAC